jgi:hypothetical protein
MDWPRSVYLVQLGLSGRRACVGRTGSEGEDDMQAAWYEVFELWQLIPLAILVGLIIFWVQYRKRMY